MKRIREMFSKVIGKPLFFYLKIIILFMSMSFSFIACSDDDDDLDNIYMFGLTSAINDKYSEIEAIEIAYSDAYKQNGLIYNSHSFAIGTSKEQILKACKQAEDAILSSSILFEGIYVYEIKSSTDVIYTKTYGIRK